MDFKACAAAMITAIPELWPSPWPGAPATRGRNEEVPGICEVPKTASMSLASRIVGPDLPQLARNAVGIPAMPRSPFKQWLAHLEVKLAAVGLFLKQGLGQRQRVVEGK